jgi:hypothetical protein
MEQLPLMTVTDERFVSHLFDTYVCDGDSITIERDGVKYVARIEHDPDTRDGDDEDLYSDEMVKAWLNDEWRFVGVHVEPVCPHCDEVDHKKGQALFGIESNMPGVERECANYLSQVAHELVGQVVEYERATGGREDGPS